MSRGRGGTLGQTYRVAELLDMISEGQIVLPEFQRDFDWGDERVAQLLATIIRRWPAGSLLLQELPEETFYELRQFDGGPEVSDENVEFVVLDGQQRLTALFQAVYDSGTFVYAIRAKALTEGATIEEVEEGIQSFRRDRWDKAHRDVDWDQHDDWIPFYSLKSPADFFAWRDRAISNCSAETREQYAQTLSDAYRLGLEAFHTYMIPAVVVESSLEMEAVARIFERVNRTGLQLSAFDLMVAKTFESGWNLRHKWDEALRDTDHFGLFFGESGGMPVIRSIALRSKLSVRESDVLRLAGDIVRDQWDSAVRATDEALSFLVDECGVTSPEFLPYEGMLITLAGVASEHDLSQHRELLRNWFWSRSFGLRYEGGTNTTTVEEYESLTSIASGTSELRPVLMSRQAITEATKKRRSAIWRAFMAALEANKPLDLVSGERLDESATTAHLLQRQKSAPGIEPDHWLVLNLFLGNRSSAGKLGGSGLDSVRRVIEDLDDSTSVLQSQLLPSPIRFESSTDFIGARADLLEAFVQKHTGYGFDQGVTED